MWRMSLSALLVVLLSSAVHAAKHPKDYVAICDLGEICSISKPSMVAFGTDDLFVFKVMQGTFICDVPAFNLDPQPGNLNKSCSIPAPKSKPLSNGHSLDLNNTNSSLESGTYVIASKLTGQVLEVQDYNVEDGADIIQAPYSGAANQRWTINEAGNGYFSIRALHSSKAIEIEGWSRNDGADVQQLTWLNSINQHWSIQGVTEDSYTIVSRFSGMALDVYESNHSEGPDVRMWTYWGGTNQQWQLIPAEALDSGEAEAPQVQAPSLTF